MIGYHADEIELAELWDSVKRQLQRRWRFSEGWISCFAARVKVCD